jgi:hypothetical protein
VGAYLNVSNEPRRHVNSGPRPRHTAVGRQRDLRMTEAPLKLLQPAYQPLKTRDRRPIDQRASAYRNSRGRTMLSNVIANSFRNPSRILTMSY